MELLTYNIVGEYCSLLLASIVLFFMFFSKPRKSYNYSINLGGFIASIGMIITNVGLYEVAKHPQLFHKTFVMIIMIVFMLLDVLLMTLVYVYIHHMSTKKRIKSRRFMIYVAGVAVIYLICAGSRFAQNKMYTFSPERGFEYTGFVRFYCIMAIVVCVTCLVLCIFNRKKLSRAGLCFAFVFMPLEVVVLSLQCMRPTTIFSSLCFVVAFLIIYLLFHCNPYDEICACQNEHSLETRIQESLLFHRKFTLMYISLPQLNEYDNLREDENITGKIAQTVRAVEALHKSIYIYRIDNGTFAVYIGSVDKQLIELLEARIKIILDRVIEQASYMMYYKMVGMQSSPLLTKAFMYRSFYPYLKEKLDSRATCACIMAKEEHYQGFMQAHRIQHVLADIRNKRDLDDPRVLCYAQPIYSVKDGGFRTAEALMRLDLDGEIIYPNKFISVAEKNSCLHVITCIMLNKVCRAIKELEAEYDFDAITINCSSSEFSDKNLHRELIHIIETNGVDKSKIRLELTESAMSEDFENVTENMAKLNQAGVQFYLDDFGTGYSNLDRIISCPFNTVKFDKTLLYKSLDSENTNSLITYMIDIFKQLGFVVLVEGVENDEQNQYSIDRGFDYIQGFKYAKPAPVEELSKFFTKKDM